MQNVTFEKSSKLKKIWRLEKDEVNTSGEKIHKKAKINK